MRPAQRHGRAGGLSAFHAVARQISGVPKLLADHAARVRKLFQRLDEQPRVAAGGDFVMAALAGENRPRPADAGPVISAAAVFLAVAIVIVTPPARTLRKLLFEHLVHDFD